MNNKFFLIIIFSFIAIYATLKSRNSGKMLKNKNITLTIGKTRKVYNFKYETRLSFEFGIKGTLNTSASRIWNREKNFKFENRYFPVIYSNENYENYRMLIFPKEFEEYGISFPDSLNWVKNYE